LQDTIIITDNKAFETIIEPNDILSVSITSPNPEASLLYNLPNTSSVTASTAAGAISQTSGYLVNIDGNIQMPGLGNIPVVGLTKKQLKDKITSLLVDRKLLLDPTVNIRFLNFKISVLGEVGRPTVITVPNERITLLEALGLAGDLTIYGRRDNVLVIREEGGTKVIKRLNLNSNFILSSPYYYLRNNDVIYVEPNKAKVASTSQTRIYLPVVFSGITMIAIIVDRLTQ
jgi:polysaccharide export outer membrane protein